MAGGLPKSNEITSNIILESLEEPLVRFENGQLKSLENQWLNKVAIGGENYKSVIDWKIFFRKNVENCFKTGYAFCVKLKLNF